MANSENTRPTRRLPHRSRSTFLTRTATDDAAQLNRRWSVIAPQESPQESPQGVSDRRNVPNNVYGLEADTSERTSYQNLPSASKLWTQNGENSSSMQQKQHSSNRQTVGHSLVSDISLTTEIHHSIGSKDKEDQPIPLRIGSVPRPVGGQAKLNTFDGVFVPTTLNVLSILMFLRFGFILGQAGVLGTMAMLIASYVINLVTTLSISAIATNGTVRGGGAYYLISRSLGPEFGGSIGLVFYMGSVFNTGLNAVGLIDCLKNCFGSRSGDWAQWLPEGYWWSYLWATIVLVICAAICLAGSGIFARCSSGLLVILLIATFSIPLSSIILQASKDPKLGVVFTGLSFQTFADNIFPRFTKHAAGSQLNGKETFQDLFGILFPATGGIFAGASMSGDLKHPSQAIPKGTLSGLALTFIAYTMVIFAMAASVSRNSFYEDTNIIQDTNISGILILLGEFATSFFSSLMGVIGSAKLLQALARDDLLPGFSIFGQGTPRSDEPVYAILFTYIVAQLTMLCDINQIASLITMTYLMTFLVTNLACFLLKISSAPNFRPSFHYFNRWTAGFGTLISGVSMFFVDGAYAASCVGVLIVIFLIIHYTTPPKSWGDVSQSLIYHQVRKYLLRLRQEHVKFWRPQILLFINDPRRQYKLIQFCNSLKKGALFVLGHVIITNDFGTAVPEARRQQAAWAKLIDFSKIKAFVNIAISPAVEWGTRNIVLSAGLGGMRPNIVMMGFYNLEKFRAVQPLVDVPAPQTAKPRNEPSRSRRSGTDKIVRHDSKTKKLRGSLPTDACKQEGDVSPGSYVTILEDLLLRLRINVAVAKGFNDLEFPQPGEDSNKKYIDLWPIQMSAEIAAESGDEKKNFLTTNFDTYTLILQLGCILNTVSAWKKAYKLRVAVFVEYESEVYEERLRVKALLENLRIEAEVLVFWLASGDVKTYQVILNSNFTPESNEVVQQVDGVLSKESWWQDMQKLRKGQGVLSASEELTEIQGLLSMAPQWPSSSFQLEKKGSDAVKYRGLKKLLQAAKRRHSSGNLGGIGIQLGMRTHRLHEHVIHRHASHASASEDSENTDNDDESTASTEDETSSLYPRSDKDVDGIEREDEPFNPQNRSTRRKEGPIQDDGPDDEQPKNPKTIGGQQDAVPDTYMLSDSKTQDTGLPSSEALDYFNSFTAGSGPQNNSESSARACIRPQPFRRASAGKFTSEPIPRTSIAPEDGAGPSVMFTDTPSPSPSRPQGSIYSRQPSGESTGSSRRATGFPVQQSIPLSFNDLPCRAQHLVLNELMQQHSDDTAVLFTTLPSPIEGTGQNEADSLSYLSDLEVFCEGLPPVLLVHSNSMTVTTSL